MSEDKPKFKERWKTEKKFKFEFFIGIWTGIVCIVLLAGIIFVGKTFLFGVQSIEESETTEEQVSSVVSEAAVAPEETDPPYESAIVSGNEEDFEENDEEDDAELKNAKTAYATTVVNVRSEASLTAAVITKLSTGEEVKILKYDKEWTKISVNGTEGYVSTIYLSATKPEQEPAATAAPRRTTAPAATPKATKKPKKTQKPKTTKKPVKTKKPAVKTPAPTEAPKPTDPPAPTEAPSPTSPPVVSPQDTPTAQSASNTTNESE